jgi:putative oxidoreductase
MAQAPACIQGGSVLEWALLILGAGMERSIAEKKIDWVVRIAVAVILGQTLFFKFSGAPESIYIFTTMGLEPWGRYGSGVAELIACILILVPDRPLWTVLGAFLSLGVITGALMSHLTKLGLTIPDGMGGNDGGLLFALACGVFIGSLWILWAHRADIPVIGKRFQ